MNGPSEDTQPSREAATSRKGGGNEVQRRRKGRGARTERKRRGSGEAREARRRAAARQEHRTRLKHATYAGKPQTWKLASAQRAQRGTRSHAERETGRNWAGAQRTRGVKLQKSRRLRRFFSHPPTLWAGEGGAVAPRGPLAACAAR